MQDSPPRKPVAAADTELWDDTRAAEEAASPGASPSLRRYRAGGLLGRGGMGEVLTADDERIGRQVALKRVLGGATSSMHQRFLREAKVQACLEHPAIVPVYDIGSDEDGSPYFTMKRLRGQTLEEILQSRADDAPSRHVLLSRFVELCLAVEYAHQHGVVHRDIKPANIMLGDFGEVYLLDWGIAKVERADDTQTALDAFEEDDIQRTREGVVMGTLGYMAPEQLAAIGELDGRADVFALGVVLVEIVSGAELIDPKDRHQRLMAGESDVAIDIADHLSAQGLSLDPMLIELLTEATQGDPKARLGTARQLADRLQTILAGDQDLIRRRELAASHAEQARQHAQSEGVHARKGAILESARALALNPENEQARETLSALLIEPPKQIPDEVEKETEQDRLRSAQNGIKWASVAYIATFLSLPLIWSIENQSWDQLVPLQLALLSTILIGLRFSRSEQPTMRMYWFAIAGNALYLALISRVMGPISVTPAIAMMSVCMFVQHGLARRWWGVVALHVAALVGPFALASLGWIPPLLKLQVIDGSLIAQSEIFRISGMETIYLLLLAVIYILGLAGWISHRHRLAQQDRSKESRLERWHLRQMLPDSSEE